jgi:hypothetical protein
LFPNGLNHGFNRRFIIPNAPLCHVILQSNRNDGIKVVEVGRVTLSDMDLESRKQVGRTKGRTVVMTMDSASILPFIVTPRNPGVRRLDLLSEYVSCGREGDKVEEVPIADCRMTIGKKEVWEYGRLGGRENRRNAQ